MVSNVKISRGGGVPLEEVPHGCSKWLLPQPKKSKSDKASKPSLLSCNPGDKGQCATSLTQSLLCASRFLQGKGPGLGKVLHSP